MLNYRSSAANMEILKTRALQFVEQARFAAERGYIELALFDIEQYVQL